VKKRIALLLTVLLVVLSLGACANAQKKALVGEWTFKVDVTDILNSTFAELGIDALHVDQTWEAFCVLSLDEEKNYSLRADAEGTVQSFQNYMVSFKSAFTDVFYEAMGGGMTREEIDALFKSEAGVTVVEFIDEMFAALFDAEVLMNEMQLIEAETGVYVVEDGKLYLPAGGEDCFLFMLEGDVLTFTGMEGDPLGMSAILESDMLAFPIELNK